MTRQSIGILRTLVFMLIATFATLGLRAQNGNQGNLVLTVHDKSGAVIPGAVLVAVAMRMAVR
jgi:hypothetical protein